MAYTSWSVSFGEQPSAAKWNILGTNDASFNDGTGIANDAITAAHLLYGVVLNRQGGTSGDASWVSSGTTNTDTSSKNIFIQAGYASTTNTTSGPSNGYYYGTATVTFPTAYTYEPIVLLTATSQHAFVDHSSAPTTTGISVRAMATSSIAAVVPFAWVAIGQ